MIIKGGAAGNVGFWSHHLMRDDTNEEVRLVEISGVLADNLGAALRIMQAIARQSRSRGNFMYQANINPRADEILTPAQMMEAVERLERNLGLAGHQRVIVEHVKHGRRHWHAIWNRVDVETLKVVDITGNFAAHARTSRELERAFGLSPTPSPAGRTKPREKLWERQAEAGSGIDRNRVSDDLTRCWDQTETGKEFRAVIEGMGYLLARGDRRDYCVVDRTGRVHSLARRLIGVEAGAIRMRLADIEPASLPSVAEARMRQRQLFPVVKRIAVTAMPFDRESVLRARRETCLPHRSTAQGREASRSLNARAAFRMARGIIGQLGAPCRAQGIVFRPSLRAVIRAAAGNVARRNSPVLAQNAKFGGSAIPVASRPSEAGRIDPTVYGKAEAAFDAEFAKWQARIDSVMADPNLKSDQRVAAASALRLQQGLAAGAVRRRIIEEEKQRAKAARKSTQHKIQHPHQP
ncbi:MAG: relaxase/mobilization nuclease domain-containing protein [Bradyrhizobium sp.]|nr:relaxase/mobilization nuclease domain-containing protein [Bradyrhizobium sp.]